MTEFVLPQYQIGARLQPQKTLFSLIREQAFATFARCRSLLVVLLLLALAGCASQKSGGSYQLDETLKANGKNSRIDILLESKGKPPCYIEIKNTTLRRNDGILFPDAVTERGRKHLEELSQLAKVGQRAVMLFFVNRPDGLYFTPADDIDPKYGLAIRSAAAAGVEIIARRAQATHKGIGIGPAIPIKL